MAGPPEFVSDFLGPEHDAPAGGGRRKPRISYVVCSTPRSGSGLLCRGLAAAGSFGAPLEYFNPIHRGMLSERWDCGPDLASYVESLHSRRTTDAGLFGSKLHWTQMAQVRAEFDPELDDQSDAVIPAELIAMLFPQPRRFVRIVRLDRDRQAVSYWRALNSNVWSVGIGSPSPAPEPPPYDFGAIERCRAEIEIGESCWDGYLSGAGAEPLRVTYEELESRHQQTIERAAAHIAPREPGRARPPATRRQGDRHSIELLERYREERRRAAANSSR